jgi:hypothetical protein
MAYGGLLTWQEVTLQYGRVGQTYSTNLYGRRLVWMLRRETAIAVLGAVALAQVDQIG